MTNPLYAPLEVIIGELKTIRDYMELIEESSCPKCKKVIQEITDEEWKHVGEAFHLIKGIDSKIVDLIKEGCMEAKVVINGPQPMITDVLPPEQH